MKIITVNHFLTNVSSKAAVRTPPESITGDYIENLLVSIFEKVWEIDLETTEFHSTTSTATRKYQGFLCG